MNLEKIEQAVKVLDGMTYFDWMKFETIVNEIFRKKEEELKSTLKLSFNDEIVTTIRARFE